MRPLVLGKDAFWLGNRWEQRYDAGTREYIPIPSGTPRLPVVCLRSAVPLVVCLTEGRPRNIDSAASRKLCEVNIHCLYAPQTVSSRRAPHTTINIPVEDTIIITIPQTYVMQTGPHISKIHSHLQLERLFLSSWITISP